MVNAIVIQGEADVPILASGETIEEVKIEIASKLPQQDGKIRFVRNSRTHYIRTDSYLSLGTGDKTLGVVHLVSDELMEALQATRYLALFGNPTDVDPCSEEIVKHVVHHLSILAFEYAVENNYFADPLPGQEVE